MKASPPDRRSRLVASLWLVPVLIALGLSLSFFSISPASAAIFSSPTPTQERLWAYVELPKPTYTATLSPTQMPTSAPEAEATPTPGQMVMEFVEEASVPAAGVPQTGNVAAYGGSKYILVDISEQHMYVYENDSLIYSWVASTGMNNATRVGTFAVQSKIPNAWGSTWSIWMPSWLGIYWSGGLENGIHALPILPNGATLWAGYLGRPVSYGCVVLGTYEAQVLYDWAEIGTPVEIQW